MTSRALLRRRVRPAAPTAIGALSTLVSDDFDPSANGVAVATLTYTARDAGGNLLASRPVSYEPLYTTVSAALGTVSAFPTTIPDTGLVPSVITITVLDAAGDPLPGIEAAQIVVSSTGTGNTIVQPTGVTNAAGQCTATIASTVAATKVVSVTVCGTLLTDTASVVVTGAGSLVADIQWNTATGTTNAALLDTDNPQEFTDLIGCGGSYVNVLNVVTAASASLPNWPTTNALRITARGPANCGNVRWLTGSPLAPSQSHYGRLYLNVQTGFNQNHGIAYNGLGAIQFVPIGINSIDGTVLTGGGTMTGGVQLSFRPNWTGAGVLLSYPYAHWQPGIEGGLGDRFFTASTTLRYEWHVEYVSALAYRFYPRVYNAAGTLLYDVNTFYPVNANPAVESLADYYLAGNTFGITDADLARQFSIGHEGPGGSTDTGANSWCGALAFSTSGWVGAA